MAARRKFLLDVNQVKTFCDNFKPADDAKIPGLKVEEAELDRRWAKLSESHEEILIQEDTEKDAELTKQIIIKYMEIYDKYIRCKTRIAEIVEAKQQQRPNDSGRFDTTLNQSSSLKLPPCDTPPFEGGYSKWPAFRDIFSAVFGNHPELSEAQKLYHLRNKTRGEAYQIVSKFKLEDENFKLAWKALKDRYENPRILVHQQMKQLFSTPAAQTESSKSLRLVQSGFENSLAIFKSYKIKTDNWDPILIHLCSTKLPEETLRAWEDSLSNHKELPTWLQMSQFLSNRIEIIETISDYRKSSTKDAHGSHPKSQTFHSHMEPDKTKYTCKKCQTNHPLRVCNYFKSLSISDRIRYVYANKFCANCLSSTHLKPNCTSEKSCAKCNRKHHTMLHLEANEKKIYNQKTREFQQSNEQSRTFVSTQEPHCSNSIPENQPADSVQTHFSRTEGTTILPTAVIDIDLNGELFTIRALLDAGSEKSFILKRIQHNLGIPVVNHNSKISGLGGTIVGNSNAKCCINLKSRHSNFNIKIQAIVIAKLAHFLPSKRVKIENLPDVRNLQLADPQFFNPSAVDMIIGSDYLPFINLDGVKSNIGNGLEARESHFGWYLSGPLPSSEVHAFSTSVITSNDTDLHEQIKKFWELEEVQREDLVSENDSHCEELFQETTFRQPDGRYVVRLPFKREFPKDIYLGHSRNMARAQYHRMENTLNRNVNLKSEYHAVLQEYLDLDHMEVSKYCESPDQKQFSFYLPHHAVVKPENKTTRVRVVFNGSKKTSSGFSLNDVLYPGPVLQADLMQIILGWRYYKYVFNGDIQKMYRQILIHPEDRKYQQILFRPDLNKEVKQFQLKTVTFGVNCAPFLAIRTLHQLSAECKLLQPHAAEILKNEIYVDDVLSGGHSLEEAKMKQRQLIDTLKSASFPLKKLTANHPYLLEDLAREDLLDEDFLKIDSSSSVKTLGIRWNAKEDYFYYHILKCQNTAATKRQVLSQIARLFDPLGWLGPIVIVAKILMQQLWEQKIEWDDGIPPHILVKWNSFNQNLHLITEIQIPRWVNFDPNHQVQIHGFCDASEKAYCGAVYIRTVAENGAISSHLLAAKTRVAPLKQTTIPKLELCGAELLAKLTNHLHKSIFSRYELFLWTDSSIVLGWLQKSPQTLKTFVANRVTKILSVSQKTQWRHVKTEENPADLGSRGCHAQDLVTSEIWWHGPPWLQQSQENWPAPKTFNTTNLETKRTANFHLAIEEEIITRFSTLNRALRVICYVFRFARSCKKIPKPSGDCITTEEITFVKNRLITLAQQIYFPREYACLVNKTPVSKKSNILTLSPFMDKEGLIRVGGRLENSALSYSERHPILLPEKSHFSLIFVKYTHHILLHSEYNIMLRAIRQGFFICRLKNLIRKCIRECKACTINKRNFQNQLMAALPPERVNFSLPFTYTGVDFAGPFGLKASILRNAKILKGYVAVFVCFTTRAIHLEVCSDLSTDAFLAAFSRFTGRRGLPKTMFSDNGRNFVGANYKLLKEHNSFLVNSEKSLKEKYGQHGFSWSFIPPYAPHMGGLWEAAVKSMKAHLKKAAGNLSFTFEEFETLLIRIEAVLNSRPISPLSENPNELLPLTPGHFIRGAPIIAAPESPTEPSTAELSHLNRWKRLKMIQHIFSQRWKTEYITELQRRFKWKTTKNNIKENDFVIVKEDNLPPTEWRLGRITKLIYGKDSNVRVAEIKTQNGIIVRPIVKLCVLPTSPTYQTNANPNQTTVVEH